MNDSRPVFGAVLCAGQGTRLAPLTQVLPKPLIPFLNTPIVTYALHSLAAAGIRRVGVNIHHLADAIPPVVDKLAGSFGLSPVYSREWELLGSGGGIRGIWHALGEPDGTLVVLNGDSVTDIDLRTLVAEHRESGREATLVAREKSPGQPGRVWLSPEKQLRGLRDHRHPDAGPELVEYEFTGIQLLEPPALSRLPMEPVDVITELYGPMLDAGDKIGASVREGFWAALDNPTLLLETTRRVLEEPSSFALAPLPEPRAEGMFVFRGEEIDDGAQLRAPVFTGMNVSIEAGARIGPNVTLDGVHLKSDAVVQNAIIFGMGTIEGEWRDCVAVAGRVASLDSR